MRRAVVISDRARRSGDQALKGPARAVIPWHPPRSTAGHARNSSRSASRSERARDTSTGVANVDAKCTNMRPISEVLEKQA
jgi:hypothetical protein